MLGNLLATLGIGLLLWILYRTIKGRPEAFSGQNLNKSFMTMGILGLILMGIIAITVKLFL